MFLTQTDLVLQDRAFHTKYIICLIHQGAEVLGFMAG